MKFWKRTAAALLAATLCASALAGCAKGAGAKKDADTNEDKDVYSATVAATIDVSLYEIKVINDKLYGTYSTYDEQSDSSSCGIVCYDFATGSTKKAELEPTTLPEIYVNSYYVDADGKVYVSATASKYEDTSADGTAKDSLSDITSSDSSAVSFTYTSQPVDIVYDSELNALSREEGEITVQKDGEEYAEDNGESIYDTLVLSDGRKVVYGYSYVTADGSPFVRVLDAEGQTLGEITAGDEGLGGNMIATSDDRVFCVVYGEETPELHEIDLEAFKMKETLCKLDWNVGGSFSAGPNGQILCSIGSKFTSIDTDSGDTTGLFDFMDCDIQPDNVCGLFALEDGTLGATVVNYDNETTDLYTFEKTDPDKVVRKTELHLATSYTDSQLQENVIKFNKTHDEYRIVIDAYMDDVEEETAYEDAVKQMNAAITAGDGPDIIDLQAVDYRQMMQKGILEDLAPYLEQDPDLSEDLFVPNVLNAYKEGDALYMIPTSFSITALAGAESKLGDDPSWTMSEFRKMAESLPDGTEIMNDLTSDGLLQTMLVYSMNEYIDWSTGECAFDSDDFVQLLEFCSKYQSSEKLYENYDYDNEPSEVTKIRNGQVLMMQLYLYDMSSYLVAKETFGEPITVKGYPVPEGNGLVISADGVLLGMNSKSEHKDAVWEFIRSFYTEDAQTSWQIGSLPIRQDCLKETLEAAKKQPDSVDDYLSTWGYNDIELEIPYATDADIEAFMDIVNKADTVSDPNYEIAEMVTEEAQAFFEGQKTASEVADIIQSRVTIYVNENR